MTTTFGSGCTGTAVVLPNDLNAGALLGDQRGCVGGSIVDDNHIEVSERLILERVETSTEKLGGVVRGDHNSDPSGSLRHGNTSVASAARIVEISAQGTRSRLVSHRLSKKLSGENNLKLLYYLTTERSFVCRYDKERWSPYSSRCRDHRQNENTSVKVSDFNQSTSSGLQAGLLRSTHPKH
jgi:hypothetical protein